MIPAIQSAASGIRLGMKSLDQAAHNIANADTEGFRRQEVRAREAPSGGVQPEVVPAEGNLTDDLVATMIAKHTVSLNGAVLRRSGEALGQIIDLVG